MDNGGQTSRLTLEHKFCMMVSEPPAVITSRSKVEDPGRGEDSAETLSCHCEDAKHAERLRGVRSTPRRRGNLAFPRWALLRPLPDTTLLLPHSDDETLQSCNSSTTPLPQLRNYQTTKRRVFEPHSNQSRNQTGFTRNSRESSAITAPNFFACSLLSLAKS